MSDEKRRSVVVELGQLTSLWCFLEFYGVGLAEIGQLTSLVKLLVELEDLCINRLTSLPAEMTRAEGHAG